MRTRRVGTAAGLLCLAAATLAGAQPAADAPAPAHAHPKADAAALPGPPPKEGTPAVPTPAAAALTLGELELLALERNPTLAQAAALVDVSRAKAFQAGLHMNPVVGYRGEALGERGLRGERQGVFIQQEIVTGGKLQLSRLKYEKEAFAAGVQAHAQRLRIVNAVQLAFYEVLAAQRLIQLDRRAVRIAGEARTTTAELLNVGQANEPDLLQAEIEADRAAVALKRAEARYRGAWARLAAVVGVPDLPPRLLAGELDPADPPPAREAALARVLRDSPEVLFALAEVDRDQVTVERERREPVPNVIVEGATGYDYDRRGVRTDVSVGLRLPVWDRNQGAIAQAQADLARARAEVVRVELALRRRFADAFERYEAAQETARTFRESSLPKARRAYELYRNAFERRRAAWPQVLVAERTWIQLGEDQANALVELRRAEVDIRGLLLGDGGLTAPPGPTPQGHLEAAPRPR